VLTGYDGTNVTGTTTFADGSVVETFVDAASQGELFVGSGIVAAGVFSVPVQILVAPPGNNFTATVTSPSGDTSPFSSALDF